MKLTEQQFLDGLTADQVAFFNARLIEIRDQFQASYAASVVEVSAAKDALLASEQSAHAATQSSLDTATASVQPLQAEIDRLTALITPPNIDANGVPLSITRTQAQLMLYRSGMLDAVEAIVAASGRETQIWYTANEWHRNAPTLLAMADALGLTSEQVDGLFIGTGEIVT